MDRVDQLELRNAIFHCIRGACGKYPWHVLESRDRDPLFPGDGSRFAWCASTVEQSLDGARYDVYLTITEDDAERWEGDAHAMAMCVWQEKEQSEWHLGDARVDDWVVPGKGCGE